MRVEPPKRTCRPRRWNGAALLAVLLASGARVQPAGAGDAAGPQRGPRPNIVFLFSDDHAQRAIGCYGSGLNRTPSIDRLADEGAVFTRSFCTTSICCPSRAAILTGKHGHVNGVIGNSHAWNGAQFTFPGALRAAGYQTALVGKWHLQGGPGEAFDHWQILSGAGGQGHYFNPDFEAKDGERTRIEGYSTDIITDLALAWLGQRDREKPFLLMCQYKAPHIHRVPPPRHMDTYDGRTLPLPPTYFDDYRSRAEYAAHTQMEIRIMPEMLLNIVPLADEPIDLQEPRYDWLARMTPAQRAAYHRAYDPDNRAYRELVAAGALTGLTREHYWYQRFIKDYLGCVAAIDDNVGRVLAYLDAHDLARNTVVIYSSDQGFFTGEHRWAEKRWMYEEALSMPFIIRWPGGVKPGTRSDALIQNIDYAPTLLELAEAPVPADVQGRSLVPLLGGNTPADWRTSIYYHYDDGDAYNLPRIEGVRTTRYKLINYYQPRQAWELFDLKTDPLELHNLHEDRAYANIRAELEQELARLRQVYRSPINAPPLAIDAAPRAKD